jgi:hypothetical protein
MQNKKLLASLLAILILFVTCVPALANVPNTTTSITKDQRLADALSTTYGITVMAEDIANLHATGVGYSEISKAYGFHALSKRRLTDILTMRQSMGWGKIAKIVDVKVSDVTRNEKAVQHAMNTSKEDGKAANSQNTSHSGKSSSGSTGSGGSNGNGGGKGSSGGNGNGGGNGKGGGGGHR